MRVYITYLRCANQFNNSNGYEKINRLAKKCGGGPIQPVNKIVREHYFPRQKDMIKFISEVDKEGVGLVRKMSTGNLKRDKKGKLNLQLEEDCY